MKIKYVLPMLAGLALASCSQDDDFVSNNMGESKYSPITFAVTLEGEGANTRAWVDDDTDGRFDRFSFQENELLSLWNGMTWSDDAWTSIGSNAVFSGTTGEEGLVFKTISMVNPGTAIMVYPADTAFVNTQGGTELKINIPAEQTAKTVQEIPYVSDVIKIGARNPENDAPNTAGYGRRYDVALKQAAGLLTIALEATKTIDFEAIGVDPIEYTKVAVVNGETGLFPTSITLGQSDNGSPVAANDKSETDPKKYAHMVNAVAIEAADEKVAEIETTDIQSGKYANFVVAPFEVAPSIDDAAKIVVSTTYGTVTVANEKGAAEGTVGPLQNVARTQGRNLAANLAYALEATWKIADTSSSFYTADTKNMGAVVRRTLSIDLSDLDMNGTEITSSAQLINVLKVYKALEIEGDVLLVLNGADNEFVMTGEALNALRTYNTADKVSLDVNTNSQKIVLANGATLEGLLDASVNLVDNSDGVTPVTAVLAADNSWTLDQSYTGYEGQTKKVNEMENRGTLTFTNSGASTTALSVKLTLAENSTMTFSGNKFYLGIFDTAENSGITVASGQSVALAGKTTLKGNVDNSGYLLSRAEVINEGYIDNKFEVSVVSGVSGASIENVGTIRNNGAAAVTYLTNNASTKDGNSATGRIILTDRDDNVSISEGGKKGYIEWTATATGTYTFKSQNTDVFNWLKIEIAGSVPTLTLQDNVDYLTIDGSDVNVKTVNDSGTVEAVAVTNLFVERSMRLLGKNAIAAQNVYVGDYILHAGGLTGTQQTEYASNVTGEDKIEYKGEIRTVGSSN